MILYFINQNVLLLNNVTFFMQADINKPVAENGSVENEVPTDGKKIKETKNSQKHHSLLLQVSNFLVRFSCVFYFLCLNFRAGSLRNSSNVITSCYLLLF